MVKHLHYEVISTVDNIEIRRYPMMILAKVTGMPDNDSFSILFNYIQGSNRSRKKIPMTAPVISSEKVSMTAPVISGGGSFAFVMPSEYSVQNVPRPTDPRVRIVTMRGRTLAIVRFSGKTSKERVDSYNERLVELCRRNGLRTMGSPFLMRYNSPFVPWPFRRNEVAIEIAH